MPRNTVIHAQATDLLIKALHAPSDQRLKLIDEVLGVSGLTSKDCKKIQEGVRAVWCATQRYELEEEVQYV